MQMMKKGFWCCDVNSFNIYIFKFIYLYINFHCASFASHTENTLPSTHPDISKNKIHFVKLNGGLAVLQVHT